MAIAVVATAITLATTTTACGGSTSDATPTATLDRTPTTTTSPNPAPTDPPTTTEPLSPEQEVEQAYRDILARYYDRLEHPNPDDPEIGELHVGASKDQVLDRNAELKEDGQRVQFTDGERPTPTIEDAKLEADERTATVVFCLIDNSQILKQDGTKIIDDDVSSRRGQATLLFRDGTWKLSEQDLLSEWGDGQGCRE